jgi:putative nucleotidyltransferase with HDIG domain
MKNVLFVDINSGKINAIHGLMNMMRGEWRAGFAASATDAVNFMTQASIDVIVADINYPDMTGINFLTRSQKIDPQVVKIAITDQKNIIEHLRTSSLAQQFLGKSYDMSTLKASILRAATLRDLLTQSMLQRLISQVRSLPSLPNLYLQIADELNKPDPTADRVGQIIAQDISMTAKVLQIVNSAYFGLPYQVVNPTQATVMLGLETIRDLVLTIKVFSNFDQLKLRHLGLTRLWNHSISVGVFSKMIARAISSDKKTFEYAFVAGLLHDIGKLVLADNLPMKYHNTLELAAQKRIELQEAEEAIFGTTHAQVGAYLLWLWNLPEQVITATAYHHVPDKYSTKGFTPVTAVHLANIFNHMVTSNTTRWALPQINGPYMVSSGISDRVGELMQMCQNSYHVSET